VRLEGLERSLTFPSTFSHGNVPDEAASEARRKYLSSVAFCVLRSPTEYTLVRTPLDDLPLRPIRCGKGPRGAGNKRLWALLLAGTTAIRHVVAALVKLARFTNLDLRPCTLTILGPMAVAMSISFRTTSSSLLLLVGLPIVAA
jgi:hypothetical protein